MLRVLFVFFVALLSLLPGCSSSESSDQEEYIIARDPDWFPLHLMGKSANLSAFSDDLLFAIAKEQNIIVRFMPSQWNALLPSLKKGECDAIISPMLPLPFRREIYDFSTSYFSVGPVLIVPVDSKVKSFKALENKQIGILTGAQATLNLENYPPVFIKTYDSIAIALEQLANKSLDGVIMPTVPAYAYCQNLYKGRLKVVPPALNNEALRVIVLRSGDNQKLINHINQGFKKIKNKDTYDLLLQKWSLQQ